LFRNWKKQVTIPQLLVFQSDRVHIPNHRQRVNAKGAQMVHTPICSNRFGSKIKRKAQQIRGKRRSTNQRNRMRVRKLRLHLDHPFFRSSFSHNPQRKALPAALRLHQPLGGVTTSGNAAISRFKAAL